MNVNRRKALFGGIAAAAVIAATAHAATPFTTFSYPSGLPDGSSGTTSSSQTALAQVGELVVNVKNFGAVGDGVHNDQPNIASAIAWTSSGNPYQRGVLFFPLGTYLVNSPIDFSNGSGSGNPGICFRGMGLGSNIIGNFGNQFIFNRGQKFNEQGGLFVIEKLGITNNGLSGGGILMAAGSVNCVVRDCNITADMAVSFAEAVNPTQVTSAATTSGSTLTFAAGVPQAVINCLNNTGGNCIVTNLTHPTSIASNTTISTLTSTTVVLSQPVNSTVSSGDNILFTYNSAVSNGTSYETIVENCLIGAAHPFYPGPGNGTNGGTFGIAIGENGVARHIDGNTHYNMFLVSGSACSVQGGRTEDIPGDGVSLGTCANGITNAAFGFLIEYVGMESVGLAISCGSGGPGTVAVCVVNAFTGACAYTGTATSGSVTGSISSATGTMTVVYNTGTTRWEGTLSGVTGTFSPSDFVGDGSTFPSNTFIGGSTGAPAFISGSGGNGTVCSLRGTPNYGLRVYNGGDNVQNMTVMNCQFAANFNKAAVAVADVGATSSSRADNTFIGVIANNNLGTIWQLPTTAGVAQFIQCNTDEPTYLFANLPASGSHTHKGDEFWVSDSPTAATSNFNASVTTGGGSNLVKLRFDGTTWRIM